MMPPRRILYLSSQFPTPAHRHAGMFSLQRVRALAAAGSEVVVVCPVFITLPRHLLPKPASTYRWLRNQIGVPQEVCVQGIHTYYPKWVRPPLGIFGWHTSAFLLWQIRQSVLNLAEEFGPEAIISSWLPDGVAACQLGERLNIPTLTIADGSDINDWPRTYRGWRNARQLINEKVSAVIYVSEALRTEGLARGLHGKKNVVIYNTVDTNLFKPGLPSPREDVFTVLGVGRFVPVKGFHILLDAFAELHHRSDKQVRLILVGDGPLRSTLTQQAANLRIAPFVEFTGAIQQEELVAYYQKSDVLCVPSFSEGSPSVVVEGMACGKPVVASQVGGVGEIVDPQSGLLVPAGDSGRLCEALLQAVCHVWDAEAIRRKIIAGFNWEQWTTKVLRLIDSAVAVHEI